MVKLEPIKSSQMLPGIASLALPLPMPSFPATTQAPGPRPSTHMLPQVGPQQPESATGGTQWVLAPASTVVVAPTCSLQAAPSTAPAGQQLVWQPQIALAGLPQVSTRPPESSAVLLASMLQQLQQHQNHRSSQVVVPPPRQQDWQSGAAARMQHAGAVPAQTHSSPPCAMEHLMAFVAPRSQPALHEPSDAVLTSMLNKLQQQTETASGHSMVQQPQDWTALAQQHLRVNDLHGASIPALLPHMHAACQEVSARHVSETGCSSRSSTTVGTASQGSPNSLSTLLACNELLKSQLQQNELQIQHCQEAAKTASAQDADSNDSTDDDSTNGTSSLSGASTTPSSKEAEGTPQAQSQSRYWTEDEHRKFLEAVRCFGAHNHKAIASYVSTRNSTQVRSHSQKFFKKLETFRGRGLPTMLRKRKAVDLK